MKYNEYSIVGHKKGTKQEVNRYYFNAGHTLTPKEILELNKDNLKELHPTFETFTIHLLGVVTKAF